VRVGHHLSIEGRVQGVFFRQWTIEQARELGVSGWVRNCPDGSVEAHVEGPVEAVEKMVDAMRHGPDGAKVDRFEVVDAPARYFESFKIRH
jgi:acylphosphatase